MIYGRIEATIGNLEQVCPLGMSMRGAVEWHELGINRPSGPQSGSDLRALNVIRVLHTPTLFALGVENVSVNHRKTGANGRFLTTGRNSDFIEQSVRRFVESGWFYLFSILFFQFFSSSRVDLDIPVSYRAAFVIFRHVKSIRPIATNQRPQRRGWARPPYFQTLNF